MTLLALPSPYDFALSTGRFRAFGPDIANRLVDGTLHRAIGGRDVRITAAPGGVDVDPLDDVYTPRGEPSSSATFIATVGTRRF